MPKIHCSLHYMVTVGFCRHIRYISLGMNRYTIDNTLYKKRDAKNHRIKEKI